MASKEELDAAIKAKGDEIRELKKNAAEKPVIQAAVDALLGLKKQYKEVTGEDWGGAPQESSKKKKQEEGKEPGGAVVDAKKAAKEKRMAERLAKAKEGAEKGGSGGAKEETAAAGGAEAEGAKVNFGDAPLVQSQALTDKHWVRISDLSPDWKGRRVLLRARLHTTRAVGKGVFLLLRQNIHSVQAVLFASQTNSKAMVKYASSLPRESVIDVTGTVSVVSTPVESATAKLVEIQVDEIYGISLSEPMLPFQVEDAARPSSEVAEDSEMGITVGMDNRLNFRWIDTRTPANQAIFRIQHGVSQLFREFLTDRGFVEIHTPKLLGGASESGSSVFNLNYFGQPACLAQSPQLYKQMACACGDFERVFEIGPVFRAEKSFTHRHLCEFTGLDLEMAINEHYYEVLELFSDLFIYIFDQLQARFSKELQAVNAQHPFEPLQYHRPSLRISFAEGVRLLREAGYDAKDDEDLDTEKEKALGRIVKEKYHTDFYIMDQYPLSVRPFYTMPSPDNPGFSNSYDMFIRGEEIVSGAQRIHDVGLLVQRCEALGVPTDSLKTYIDAFRYGALPHGGGGIGLERVVMLYLGLGNIRKASLFPRDPKRITP